MSLKNFLVFLTTIIILVFIATACGKTAATPFPTEEPPIDQTQASAETSAPVVTPVETSSAEFEALPMEPQTVTFQAADGTELQGYYYPAAVNPAPVVVMMHWVMGNMSDWYEIAVWLQNRGQANPFPNGGDPEQFKWWDPSWFPVIREERSYGVFIFNFRDCKPMSEMGCPAIDEEGWLQDAQAAMIKASELEGVDPTKIVAIGSSIGADGAADGCAFLNEQKPGSCQGSLSLSPGSYLGQSYPPTVTEMGNSTPPAAAWCIASPTEFGICESAELMNNSEYIGYNVPDGQHGNMLLRPDLDPLPMDLILDFLQQTVD